MKKQIPQFTSVFDDEDGVYPILGEFGRFLLDNIDNEVIASKSFHYINRAIELGGNETEDVIVMQIFHPIYSDKSHISKVKDYLSGKALKVFLEFENRYDERPTKDDDGAPPEK
ncbi:hypothetical protein [Parapedobacter tibetensis]|uniref:hypothetical protein n=1 Tax=Parapedobacter tibetensis TaxID=2972951 RepID=UPI00214D8E03|nr:hypothetical protein [Parapedobacter tibetensis]